MRLYARALKAKHKPKYSLGIICQWIEGLVNSPLLARPAYGSSVLCSRDESGTASRTKPFIGNSWRYFSELCSVLDTTPIGAMHRIVVKTSWKPSINMPAERMYYMYMPGLVEITGYILTVRRWQSTRLSLKEWMTGSIQHIVISTLKLTSLL